MAMTVTVTPEIQPSRALAVDLNKARRKWQQSSDYQEAFSDAGKQAYRDHGLVSAFIAGWTAREEKP